MTIEDLQNTISRIEGLYKKALYDDAISLSLQLLQIISFNSFPTECCKIHMILGSLYEVTSKFPNAIEHYKRAQELNILQNNNYGIADCLISIGNVYDSQSEFLPAIQHFQESLQISKEIDYIPGMTKSLGNIGIVYLNLSDYTTALQYLEQALSLSELHQNSLGIAINVGNIGNVFRHLKEYTKAIEYYTKALEINTHEQKYDGAAINLGNIGIVYYYLQRYEQALEYYRKAIAIKEKHGVKHSIAINLSNIGNVYFSLEEYSQALEYYLQALNINTEFGDKRGIGFNLKNLAYVYLCMNDFEQSFDYVSQSWKVATELQDYLLQMECLEIYSQLYEKEGNFEQAVIYFKRFIEVKNIVSSEDAKHKAMLFDQKRLIEEDEKSRQLKLARFQVQEKIFHNILPVSIANRLIEGETSIADSYEHVSIFFSEIVGFNEISTSLTPTEVVETLNGIFRTFDTIGANYGIEKIKTIGDVYMAVCGVPDLKKNHEVQTANFALEITEIMNNFPINDTFKNLQMRIGLHCGTVVAGIIGERKFAYDVWGDAVNIASRLESNSEPGRIHISEQFAKSIESHDEFKLIPRGEITIKGKGSMNTYWLEKSI